MNRLQDRYSKLLLETDPRFHRYMYDRIGWNSRMIGLTGPRGVGKTTLVLQYIKENLPPDTSLYVTAEDFYFADHRLLDLADDFVRHGGKHLFIDEIHRYKDWSKELKLMYDYHPELQVVFTGSSVLDINKGVSDLSRRAVMYHMQGLSFREYLLLFHDMKFPVYTLEDVLRHKVEIPPRFHPLQFFPDYLRQGYYPFSPENQGIHIQQIVNLALESDIPQYAGMNVSTGRKLKRLLAIIAKSVPFKPNISSIAAALGVSRNSVADYCLYIEEAGLIAQLRDDTGGIRGLGKVDIPRQYEPDIQSRRRGSRNRQCPGNLLLQPDAGGSRCNQLFRLRLYDRRLYVRGRRAQEREETDRGRPERFRRQRRHRVRLRQYDTALAFRIRLLTALKFNSIGLKCLEKESRIRR